MGSFIILVFLYQKPLKMPFQVLIIIMNNLYYGANFEVTETPISTIHFDDSNEHDCTNNYEN